MARAGFKPRSCRSQSGRFNHSTIRPPRLFSKASAYLKNCFDSTQKHVATTSDSITPQPSRSRYSKVSSRLCFVTPKSRLGLVTPKSRLVSVSKPLDSTSDNYSIYSRRLVIVMHNAASTNAVQNPLAPLCYVLGKDTLRHFFPAWWSWQAVLN